MVILIKDYTPNSHTSGLEYLFFEGYENPPSKVTILSHNRKEIPYRKVIIQDDKDKKRNFIYDSDEVIYGQYQQEDDLKKLNKCLFRRHS